MNLEKVVFGFFVLLAATLNMGFFVGDISRPELHSIYELFAALDGRFAAVGAGPAAVASKLARGLAGAPAPRPGAEARGREDLEVALLAHELGQRPAGLSRPQVTRPVPASTKPVPTTTAIAP